MVARGDLGAQIPLEQVPSAQQRIVQLCRQLNKPVIVASQLLESMIEYPTPTRAEVADVSEAVRQRADALMLSGESAMGQYPEKALTVLRSVSLRIERWWREQKRYEAMLLPSVGSYFSEKISEEICISAAKMATRDIPETADVKLACNGTGCLKSSKFNESTTSITVGIFVVVVALSVIGILTFTLYRRRKQKVGGSFHITDSHQNTDEALSAYRKNGSPLVNLEYSTGWDPLADSRNFSCYSQDVFQCLRFNLEEVESATRYFSELNLLGKNSYSSTYKGVLRDGSVVAVKSISKTSCKSDECEFIRGLNMLTSLRNDNLDSESNKGCHERETRLNKARTERKVLPNETRFDKALSHIKCVTNVCLSSRGFQAEQGCYEHKT
ncbi:hypothetical protein Fmac_024262 [Flemingia macrophylla]|uniref:Pyruvate kinase n=1 Tax=Flemingia macrophylla TaxID=520843 RepID=A0ABD1LNW2_9FABA